jgi:hypothetical protein
MATQLYPILGIQPMCDTRSSMQAMKSECRTTGLIERILAHLKRKEATAELVMLPEGRGPPQVRLFD